MQETITEQLAREVRYGIDRKLFDWWRKSHTHDSMFEDPIAIISNKFRNATQQNVHNTKSLLIDSGTGITLLDIYRAILELNSRLAGHNHPEHALTEHAHPEYVVRGDMIIMDMDKTLRRLETKALIRLAIDKEVPDTVRELVADILTERGGSNDSC